jgi:RecA-family ATPase
MVVLDGDPSLGKSTLTLDWSARVSTGSPWPDGAVCELGDTVLLSAEDGISDTIRPRLDAAGGDPTRVHALTGITYRDGDVLRLRPPTLPADLPELRAAIQRTRARLVVIDVLMAFLGDTVNSHRDQDVRRVLAALAAIADETGATIVLLRHLNKTTGGSALYRGGGSIGIIGAARAGFVVAADPDDDSGRRRILAVTKMNLAEEPPSISYTLEGTDSGVARVVWGEVSQHRANTLLAQHDHEDGEDTTEQGFAVDWLVDFLDLNQGRAARTDVVKEAKDAGITLATLNRARVKAGVQFISEGFPRKTYWTRPVTISSQSSQSSHLLRVETTEMTETTDSQQPAQSSQSSQLSQPIKGETTEMTETTEACPNCGRPLAGPAHPHCQTSDRHEA